MNAPVAQSKTTSPMASTNRPPANAPIPIWFRIGIPAVLAMLAGILNANTVQQQLNPIEVYAISAEVSPGMLLIPEHLQLVKVGGNLDRTKLLTVTDLLATLEIDNASAESIRKSLAKTPLVYSRFIASGELLTRSCLGGLERAVAGQQRIEVPVANIIGDYSRLLPGQAVYFHVLKSTSNIDPDDIQEIGPFRVAYWTRKQFQQDKDVFLPLIYAVGPNGQKSRDAGTLLAAAHSKHGVRLAILDKAMQDAPALGRSAAQPYK